MSIIDKFKLHGIEFDEFQPAEPYGCNLGIAKFNNYTIYCEYYDHNPEHIIVNIFDCCHDQVYAKSGFFDQIITEILEELI